MQDLRTSFAVPLGYHDGTLVNALHIPDKTNGIPTEDL